MTIRFSSKGYKPTKREKIEQYMDTFERNIGRTLDYLDAGEITKDQFINGIKVAYSNYK